MPRIAPSTVWKAHKISAYLPLLLPATRTIPDARAEWRWIKQHLRTQYPESHGGIKHALVLRFCRRRGRGEPLQYVLGSQPFGPLEIECKRGILIPRADTESAIYYLAWRIASHIANRSSSSPSLSSSSFCSSIPATLNLLDLCTGTGCIPLLLSHLLSRRYGIRVAASTGVDNSAAAVQLARSNGCRAAAATSAGLVGCTPLTVCHADVFDDAAMARWFPSPAAGGNCSGGTASGVAAFDVLTANPPYIAPAHLIDGRTARSVRKWEPHEALVPPPFLQAEAAAAGGRGFDGRSVRQEDVFYARILALLDRQVAMNTTMTTSAGRKDRFVWFEVGDSAQGLRVVAMLTALRCWSLVLAVELWRDVPDDDAPAEVLEVPTESGLITVPVKGSGEVRSVFVCLQQGANP